jgi:thiol-disulfide isomerase/thioredoxin
MSRLAQKVELVANATIIVAAVLLIGVVSKKYFFSPKAYSQPARVQPVVGSKLNLPAVQWAGQQTVVVALQTGCGFCNESAPFYRRLAESVKGRNVQLIAAFPTPVESSAAHLQELGVTGFAVKQLPLDALQTSGTPTLILTNAEGEITDYWLGKLTPEREAEVLEKLDS